MSTAMTTRQMPKLPTLSTFHPISTGPSTAPVASSPISHSERDPLPTSASPVRRGRPSLGPRKSSGSLIISRDSPTVEMAEEEYGEEDARSMSPRRSGDELDKMGDEARRAMEEQARVLQKSLSEIVERVESVKSEHERLEGGCRFLESYIGELMQTSKITSAGAATNATKVRGRAGRK